MQRKNSNERPRRRGAVAIMVVMMFTVLVGFFALTFDVGTLYNTKTDMQSTADSAALAAISVVAYAAPGTNPLPSAINAASQYVEGNLVMGRTLTLEPGTDVVFGQSVFDAVNNSYVFTAGATPTNAVRVTVRSTADSPNGAAPLYFGSIFGTSGVDVTEQAVAMFVSTNYEYAGCNDAVPAGKTMMCHSGDRDDSDDSQGEFGPPDSDDSDDSDSGPAVTGDSESSDSSDSDGPFTILVDTGAEPHFLQRGDTVGPCACVQGDSDDSDDSQGEFGPPDSDDSDDSSDSGSDNEGGDDDDSGDSNNVTICHIPPGNPAVKHTITVGAPAVPAHLAHGDSLGVCAADSRLLIFLVQ